MDKVIETILSFTQSFFTLLFFIALYYLVNMLLKRQSKGKSDQGLLKSIILFSIIAIGIISLILALPLEDEIRKDITNLIGYVISAVLALSSATFMGNALAGIMLRTINNSKPGDFIEVNEFFGRITERGLFHTEIQTENRDLTTIPNLYLATNPVKVTRTSGTLISGEVSLGYDVNRMKIEKALIKAGEKAGLTNSFVRITTLGDFSVVYKIYGLVEDIKTVLSARSRLNAAMLDVLHDQKIEIVSPNFMNQRQVGDAIFIPKKQRDQDKVVNTEAPENLIFDKAEEAETIEKKKESLESVEAKLKELQSKLKEESDPTKKEQIKSKIDRFMEIKEKMATKIDEQVEDFSTKK